MSPLCRPSIRSAASKLYRSHTEPPVRLTGAKETSKPVLPVLAPDADVAEVAVGVVPRELVDGVTVVDATLWPPVGNPLASRNVLPLVWPVLFAPAPKPAIMGTPGAPPPSLPSTPPFPARPTHS